MRGTLSTARNRALCWLPQSGPGAYGPATGFASTEHPARDGDHPDVYRADFAWCMTAIDWGWSVEDVARRLMEESDKAKENGSAYATRTAQNAAAAVLRRRGGECAL